MIYIVVRSMTLNYELKAYYNKTRAEKICLRLNKNRKFPQPIYFVKEMRIK